MNFEPGDKIRISRRIRLEDSRSATTIKVTTYRVLERYRYFVLLLHPAGYRETFRYWDLKRGVIE